MATRLSGEKTYSRTVQRALEEFVRRIQARQILELAGTGLWQGSVGNASGFARPAWERQPMILIDTSVWVEVFKAKTRLQLEDHLDLDEVVTCLPVVQEVLQGFRDEGAYRKAHSAMFAFPVIESPLGRPIFEDAVRLHRTARRAGLTVRSSVDCVIAACALRHDVEVLHRDRDFSALAKVSGLRQRQL